MIRTTVKTFNRFPEITEKVRAASLKGLERAALVGAETAQANASIDLQVRVVPPGGDLEGYSSGIKSHRHSDTDGDTTPVAEFFDKGTLGKRTKPLKRSRKASWTQRNPGGAGTHTATRGDVEGKGIAPERFFGKARTAGRKALLETIAEELGPLK